MRALTYPQVWFITDSIQVLDAVGQAPQSRAVQRIPIRTGKAMEHNIRDNADLFSPGHGGDVSSPVLRVGQLYGSFESQMLHFHIPGTR